MGWDSLLMMMAFSRGSFFWRAARGHKTRLQKIRLDGNACTAVPVSKGSVLTTCGTYHLVSLYNEVIPGAYPWHIRAPQKGRVKKGKKKNRKNIKVKKRKKMKQKTSMRSGRRPSPEGARLLVAGTINPMICPVDGPTKGRHGKTRRKTIQKRGQRQRAKKQNQQSYVQLADEGRH